MIIFDCFYTDPSHQHEYPDDWIFGGADGTHPGADPRFQPTVYTYYDADATPIHVTCSPLCDDQALDEFTDIARQFPGSNPFWLSVKRPKEKAVMLPWHYDKATDMLVEVNRG
jgi:hypothetical protein